MDSLLRDSVAVDDRALAPPACRVLDRGAGAPSASALAQTVHAIIEGKLPEVARDRNAICHRALLAGRRGVSRAVIVKSPRWGPQRTNPDATFEGEAKLLAQLPALGIDNGPRLVARVAAAGSHFLFMSEVPGKHPDPRKHPLGARELRAIAEALQTMDRIGFMHYDLKAANVLTDGGRAAFIDFEFARTGTPWNADTPAEASFCEDFNVANNPFVRARSNIANFEFRCLHRYLVELENGTPEEAEPLFLAWLAVKASYHAQMASCLSGRAASHERLLARLLADPPMRVVGIERMLIAYRTAVFERDARAAARSRRAITAATDARRLCAAGVPSWYAEGVMRVIDRVARSVHPAP